MTTAVLDDFDLDLRIDDAIKPGRHPEPTVQGSCQCSFRTLCTACTTGHPINCTG
jgi:hypothetical protein